MNPRERQRYADFIALSTDDKITHMLSVAKMCIDSTPTSFARKFELLMEEMRPTEKIKYRVHFTEHERGWGPDYYHRDYDTREEAEEAIKRCNSQNTAPVAPDFYTIASDEIEIVEV